jgi:predicted NodU family carbamoyl transferase
VSESKTYFPAPPFMAITYNVRPDKVKEIPTPTHVDNTARIQTISRSQNRIYYDLISNFENETGIPMVTNTSLNIMNQPICLSAFTEGGWVENLFLLLLFKEHCNNY